MVFLYFLIDLESKRFLVLINREQKFQFCEKAHHLLHGKDALNIEADFEIGAWNRPNHLGTALGIVTYFLLRHISKTVLNNTLTQFSKAGSALLRMHCKHRSASNVSMLPSLVTFALGVTCPLYLAPISINMKSVGPELSSTDVMVAK